MQKWRGTSPPEMNLGLMETNYEQSNAFFKSILSAVTLAGVIAGIDLEMERSAR